MPSITIDTVKPKQIIDITDDLSNILNKTDIRSGIVNLFLTHTTAALTTADLDPGTDLDMLDVFAGIIPKLNFRHPHNPAHAPDHILSSIIGASLTLPFVEGKLVLGTWQRVVLVELDGPRRRRIIVTILAGS